MQRRPRPNLKAIRTACFSFCKIDGRTGRNVAAIGDYQRVSVRLDFEGDGVNGRSVQHLHNVRHCGRHVADRQVCIGIPGAVRHGQCAERTARADDSAANCRKCRPLVSDNNPAVR